MNSLLPVSPQIRAASLPLCLLCAWGGALMVSCGDDSGPAPEGGFDAVDYAGLAEDASWTYRSVADTAGPQDEDLLLARHLGEGVVEFRQGARWADAQLAGELGWDASGSLSLQSWELGESSGSGPVVLVEAGADDGAEYSSGSWSCVLNYGELETYYARFPESALVSCEGSGGMAGDYGFARDFGLVSLDGAGVFLDLVAPW